MPAPVFGTVHLCPGPGEGPAVLAQGTHGPPDLGQEQLRSKQAPGLLAKLMRVLLPVSSLRWIILSALSRRHREELVKTQVAFSLEGAVRDTIWVLKKGPCVGYANGAVTGGLCSEPILEGPACRLTRPHCLSTEVGAFQRRVCRPAGLPE